MQLQPRLLQLYVQRSRNTDLCGHLPLPARMGRCVRIACAALQNCKHTFCTAHVSAGRHACCTRKRCKSIRQCQCYDGIEALPLHERLFSLCRFSCGSMRNLQQARGAHCMRKPEAGLLRQSVHLGPQSSLKVHPQWSFPAPHPCLWPSLGVVAFWQWVMVRREACACGTLRRCRSPWYRVQGKDVCPASRGSSLIMHLSRSLPVGPRQVPCICTGSVCMAFRGCCTSRQFTGVLLCAFASFVHSRRTSC